MLLFTLPPDGFLWTAGRNICGQLSSHEVDRPTFTKVQDLPKAKKIAMGFYHCTVLTEDNEVTSLLLRHPTVGVGKSQFVKFPVRLFLIF